MWIHCTTITLTKLLFPWVILRHLSINMLQNWKSLCYRFIHQCATSLLHNSDNFLFQNNGIKKCTCWKTMRFFGKAMILTRLHTWFILIIKHMHFIKIITIHVLNKISFHNTIPHRSQSYRPCYSRTLINSPLFCTSSLCNHFFLVVENHCVFSAHIFWKCAFFPRNVREKRKMQTKKLSLIHSNTNNVTNYFKSHKLFVQA